MDHRQSSVPAKVAEKVLRRAEIAKVARNLQDRLALASFKAQNGWQDRPLRAIEPEVTAHLKRKRPYSSDDILSDSSSVMSEYALTDSSPPLGSITNDNRRCGAYTGSGPYKHRPMSTTKTETQASERSTSFSVANTFPKGRSRFTRMQGRQLPGSSPIRHHTQPVVCFAEHSFISDSVTIPESASEHSPLFDMDHASEEDDTELPFSSYSHPASSSVISSSPSRTPPPATADRRGTSKQAGADLLLYLANSPSRSPSGSNARQARHLQHPPSTPPSQRTRLPSSVINTPGAGMTLFNGALNTPGQGFNFADFVNVTPSPAQVQWGGRTPGISRTPAAARAARRGLNFDGLIPPISSGSPTLKRKTTTVALGLELGEELMPRS